MLDRRIPLIVLAAIVAAVLGVAAGCGGDDEDTAEEAGTTEALTTTPAKDPVQPTADGADHPCAEPTPDIERAADTNPACTKDGEPQDQRIGADGIAGPTEENAAIVHRFYDAWNRRDFGDAVRLVHEDFELHLRGGFSLIGERFDGRDGLLRFMRRLAGTVGAHITVERTIDMGERVGVIAILKASGVLGGALGGLRVRQVWTFRDGKVIRLDSKGRRSRDARRPYLPRGALEAARERK